MCSSNACHLDQPKHGLGGLSTWRTRLNIRPVHLWEETQTVIIVGWRVELSLCMQCRHTGWSGGISPLIRNIGTIWRWAGQLHGRFWWAEQTACSKQRWTGVQSMYDDIHNLRGIAAANLSASSMSLCLSSCLPMLGGPMSTIGLLWFALG